MKGNATDKYHDIAMACSLHLLDFIYGLLRKEEEKEVFDGMYERVRVALEIFDLQSGGVQEKLTPSNN